MGAHSRQKGARGEREVVGLAKLYGFSDSVREAPMQAGHGDRFSDVASVGRLKLEVKRYRKTPVNKFARECLKEVPGFIPALAYRDDGSTQWYAVVTLEDLFKLERQALGKEEK